MQATRPTPLGSAGRRVTHVIGIALGWALFVYGWMRVAARPWDAHELWVLIVASAIVLPTLTVFWIVHNVVRYRGKHRRRGTALVECRYDVDWSGRAVQADWNALASADRIWIDVEDGAKRYRSFVTVPLPPAADATPVSCDSTHHLARGSVPSASLDSQAAS